MSAKKSFLARLFQGKGESHCCEVSIIEDEPTPEEIPPAPATVESGRSAENDAGSGVQDG